MNLKRKTVIVIELALSLIIPLLCMYCLWNFFLVPITFWQRLIGGIVTVVAGAIVFVVECLLVVECEEEGEG